MADNSNDISGTSSKPIPSKQDDVDQNQLPEPALKLLSGLTEIQLINKSKGSTAASQMESVLALPNDAQLLLQTRANDNYYTVIITEVENVVNVCKQCSLTSKIKYRITHKNSMLYICDDSCLDSFKTTLESKIASEGESSTPKCLGKFIHGRKCAQCMKPIVGENHNLWWQMMEFCDASCLVTYQTATVQICSYCNAVVQKDCMGKYCVRFGCNIKQFCSNSCLDDFKKGFKFCSYCQRDISGEDGFLAPVGVKAQFKEFCTEACMLGYDAIINNRMYSSTKTTKCVVCHADKEVAVEYIGSDKVNSFCGEPCFIAFKFVNNAVPDKCIMCKKYFDSNLDGTSSVYIADVCHKYCSEKCLGLFIVIHRKIVSCNWCKAKKYNFDMIVQSDTDGQKVTMCSTICLSLYKTSMTNVNVKRDICQYCNRLAPSVYHLKMVDSSMRSLCSYDCVLGVRNMQTSRLLMEDKAQSKSTAATTSRDTNTPAAEVTKMPIITSVESLAEVEEPQTSNAKPRRTYSAKPRARRRGVKAKAPDVEPKIRHIYIVKQQMPPPQRNVMTMCKVTTKDFSCGSESESKEIQTDEVPETLSLVPVPVPLNVPAPLWMYSIPHVVPFPFPLPIPIPRLIPTTKDFGEEIIKEIRKIRIETPADPFEAELLTMAEMIAADKREENDVENENTFKETVSANSSCEGLPIATSSDTDAISNKTLTFNEVYKQAAGRAVKKHKEGKNSSSGIGQKLKQVQKFSSHRIHLPAPDPATLAEQPDANKCLKYTFGINAWKQWIGLKNDELKKYSKQPRLFKTDILQLTASELNHCLCLFLKEVRKPNGDEYAPDTMYYLCLGIQQYLIENSRVDNIFCDSYYDEFTDCLDEIGKKFSVLYNDSHFIVTRVEEEHLWESRQLGAQSPYVLLTSLLYFNTKYFHLTTAEDHMQLSFSHIMKHWKRSSTQAVNKGAGSRHVLLRFYPPHSSTDITVRKRPVYEQHENESNPLRCPVKLYEFYLSKCPESVKTRSDVFYLLPERSCVPDSPVWFSTTPLSQKFIQKVLHRVKMVKEVNVAILTN